MIDQGQPQPITSFRHDERQAPVVILFDLLNQGLGSQGYGAEEIIRALEHLESSDSLSLYLLTREATLQPVRALSDASGQNIRVDAPSGSWPDNIRPILDAAMNSAVGLRQHYIDNIRTTHRAIVTLGQKMAAIPGRKYMVLVSQGLWAVNWPEDGRSVDYLAMVSQFARSLDNQDITVNSVDPGTSESVGSVTLEEYANVTGGKVYYKDIEKGLSETLAASQSSYVIQYDAPGIDGKYHKIHVTCTRKGIRLQAKQGYVANP